jgi:hypothetical protein
MCAGDDVMRRGGIHTGSADEKKSISFPIVKGMLIETDEDTSSNPIAVTRGLRSGLASATILRKEDTELAGSANVEGRTRDNTEGFEGGTSGLVDKNFCCHENRSGQKEIRGGRARVSNGGCLRYNPVVLALKILLLHIPSIPRTGQFALRDGPKSNTRDRRGQQR